MKLFTNVTPQVLGAIKLLEAKGYEVSDRGPRDFEVECAGQQPVIVVESGVYGDSEKTFLGKDRDNRLRAFALSAPSVSDNVDNVAEYHIKEHSK
jgi:hypothetical protein